MLAHTKSHFIQSDKSFHYSHGLSMFPDKLDLFLRCLEEISGLITIVLPKMLPKKIWKQKDDKV